MGAALSSACSSFVSIVESFVRESYGWVVSNLFGGMSSNYNNKGNGSGGEDVVIRSRGINLDDDDVETGGGLVIRSRGLDLSETPEVKETTSIGSPSGLGDVWKQATNVVEDYQNGKIRSIASDGKPLKVTFTNNHLKSEIILCWVSSNGDLYHYYRLQPNGGGHLENTKTGDAFAIFKAPPPEVGDTPLEEYCNRETIVAAYRPTSVTEECNHHVVNIGQNETIVATQGGFLRGSTKKQKVTQWTISVAPKEPKPKQLEDIIDTTNKVYEKQQYGEWTVYCEPGCWNAVTNSTLNPEENGGESKTEDDKSSSNLQETFQADLQALSQRLPDHVREILCESTSLYMNTTHVWAQKVDNAVGCFHPGRDWLEEHKMNPNKCGQVEFYNVTNYADHRKLWGTGGIILHEFCHAYHNKHIEDGYENKEIIDCYQAAMDEGLYDQCNYHACYVPGKNDINNTLPFVGDGVGEDQSPASQQPEYEVKTTKHYACTNHMEYFAELSVAFLADGDQPQEEYNKWYPHNAKQLKEHDPRAYALLEKLWGVERQ